MNMASLPGLGGVYSKSSLGLSFPTSQLELDSPTCRCLSWGCASFLSRTLLRYQVIGLILQHHGGESWEGSGRLGSNEALVTPAASCPWLFSCCPARLRSHCPTPTPSSSKLLIPDSCDGCGQRWGGGEEGECVTSLLLVRPPPPPDSLGARKAPPLQFSEDGQFLERAPFVSEPRGNDSSLLKPGGPLFRQRRPWDVRDVGV